VIIRVVSNSLKIEFFMIGPSTMISDIIISDIEANHVVRIHSHGGERCSHFDKGIVEI